MITSNCYFWWLDNVSSALTETKTGKNDQLFGNQILDMNRNSKTTEVAK